jgi:hypothetical protein
MAWRKPQVPGEFPTLGYQVGEWIEAYCVIPDGIHQGEKYRLTDEMWKFLLRFYRLHPRAEQDDNRQSAAFVYRGSLFMRPQKWGKGPFAGTICLAEAFGPTRFDGWDAAHEPVGRPQPTPWVEIVATSEDQTDNTWLAIFEMATRGRIANFAGVDIGIEDINLPSGGKIAPRTSAGSSRLGARITFSNLDETGLMLPSNGGIRLATTIKRNLGGMGGRWLETSNMYDPSEGSVAQMTHESKAADVLIDYRPPRRTPDLKDREVCLEELRIVYGDSWWVDHERIYADATDVAVCPTPGDAYRFFFNLPHVGQSAAVDAAVWDAKAKTGALSPGETIALGFDGSRSMDCTSIVASRISDGRWFHIKTWNPADYPKHRVPRSDVDRVLTAAFEAYDVRYLYGDPYKWQEYFAIWDARWPGDRVVEFPTNVDRRMDNAITRFQTAFAGKFTHDGNPTLAAHARNAALARGGRKKPRPEEDQSVVAYYQKIIKKHANVHIDAFIAGILAEEARGQAIEDGAMAPSPYAKHGIEWL